MSSATIQSLPPARPLRIVLAGGSGQLGQVLASHFQSRGHQAVVLTRGPYAASWQTVHWDGEVAGPWIDYLEGSDVCINLAGHRMNSRQTTANREAIYHSRIHTTCLLGEAIAGLSDPPWLWMNASTADIYRHATDHDMEEQRGELGGNEQISRWRRAPQTWNFLVGVAVEWERVFRERVTPNTRKIALRTASVFSPQPGTAFSMFSNLVRLSLGGKQGSGRQYVSWIHEADFAGAIEFLMHHEELDGAVNLSSPNPLPNREFMESLRDAWGMPNGLPVPWPLTELEAFFLRVEPVAMLKSRRVVPARLLDAGFQFQFPDWSAAAEDLVARWRRRD